MSFIKIKCEKVIRLTCAWVFYLQFSISFTHPINMLWVYSNSKTYHRFEVNI
jgi:hypothetical protein